MTADQLNALFLTTNTKSIDFVCWADKLGYKVGQATVSRHRAGTQGITVPWAICYTLFFNQYNQ